MRMNNFTAGLLALTVSSVATAQIQPINKTTTTNISTLSATPVKKITRVSTGAFSTVFRPTAVGRNDGNAYLLSYLSTLVYPQYLAMVAGNTTASYESRLHSNPTDFENEFKRYTSSLFASPEYKFIHKSFPTGYDPEAMVISTPQAIYVVFRGTDRVGSNAVGSAGYEFAEWISTDFDVRQLITPELTGKVQAGIWLSLMFNNFKEDLFREIENKGGRTKKVWITGHSLGGGQAQLFAMYMAKKGITPQGVYVYASPHPGTQEFADEINRILPNNRLQRFDFLNDPITTIAPYLLGYRRSGTRVFYNDINSIQFGAPERSELDVANLIPGVIGAIGNAATDFISEKSNKRIKLDIVSLGGSPMCYHHPLWYVRAAYGQLTADQRAKVPAPLPLPDATGEACDVLTVERGKTANLLQIGGTIVKGMVDDAVTNVTETLEKIRFTASSIIDNVTGTAITAGDYYIKSYASDGKLGLNEQDGFTNGSDMRLTTSRSKVKIERFGAIGYTIQFGTRTVTTNFLGFTSTETKPYVLDSDSGDLFDSGSTTIQLWEKNNAPGFSANQRWLFIRLKNDKYLIKNLANGKLLDANNACVNDNSCGVKSYNPVTDDQTQIWILERAN